MCPLARRPRPGPVDAEVVLAEGDGDRVSCRAQPHRHLLPVSLVQVPDRRLRLRVAPVVERIEEPVLEDGGACATCRCHSRRGRRRSASSAGLGSTWAGSRPGEQPRVFSRSWSSRWRARTRRRALPDDSPRAARGPALEVGAGQERLDCARLPVGGVELQDRRVAGQQRGGIGAAGARRAAGRRGQHSHGDRGDDDAPHAPKVARLTGHRPDVVGHRRRVRRTLRDGDASAGDERDEDEQEGKKPSHYRLRS